MRVVVGAGKTALDGWLITQEEELNLLRRSDFEKLFADELPTAFLAEHVWEHMTLEEGYQAAKNCFDYLTAGGYVRVAVPDAYFRNECYQNLVKVGGNGNPEHPAFSHKVLYNYHMLCEVFRNAGFEVELLEWCDENGVFHYRHWNENDGKIGRSYRFDTRNGKGKLGMVSLIIDAKKPVVK